MYVVAPRTAERTGHLARGGGANSRCPPAHDEDAIGKVTAMVACDECGSTASANAIVATARRPLLLLKSMVAVYGRAGVFVCLGVLDA